MFFFSIAAAAIAYYCCCLLDIFLRQAGYAAIFRPEPQPLLTAIYAIFSFQRLFSPLLSRHAAAITRFAAALSIAAI